jgi:YHS domain-containing protein
MEQDPVCGMIVDPETAASNYDYDGTTYYFCAVGCKVAFEKDPEQFLGADPGDHTHHGHHQAANGAETV